MKKKVTGFFCILLVLLLVCSGVFTHLSLYAAKTDIKGADNLVGLSKQKEDSIDVLFLGDSESIASVSPLQMWSEHGFTAYNAGIQDQRMQEAYHVLLAALRKQKPKLVVLEMNEAFSYRDLVSETRRTMLEVLMNVFPAIRFHNLWRVPFNGRGTDSTLDTKGFVINQTVKPYTQGPYMHKTKKETAIHFLPLFYLNRIADACRARGITLLLYSTPSPKNSNYKKHNAIQSYADSRGLVYLDMNLDTQAFGLDWKKDVLDGGDHVNFYGAKKVTAYLGDYISKNYQLPDHRGDTAFADWESDAKAYENLTA